MKYKLLYISSVRSIDRRAGAKNASSREGPERARRHADEQSEEAWMSGLNQQS